MDLTRKWQLSCCLALLISCMVLPCEGRALKAGFVNYKHHEHYNRKLAITLAQYASAVYLSDLDALISWSCSRCNGLTKSFMIAELIVDVQNCLQAFVGVDKNLGAIVIAFRGTQENSILNWIDDLLFKLLDLDSERMPGARVHRGFYYAYHNTLLRPQILKAVHRIHKINNSLPIMVTGHSMGGAMAAFCALDLKVNYQATKVQVVTFGQPRVGNAVFAKYYSEIVPNTIRVTHGHDIVPHLPPYYSLFPLWTYHHFPQEVWIHMVENGTLAYEVEKICDLSGEDPTCSRSALGFSISDHFYYYNISMQADTWGECRWILEKEQVTRNVNLTVDIASPKSSMTMHAKEAWLIEST